MDFADGLAESPELSFGEAANDFLSVDFLDGPLNADKNDLDLAAFFSDSAVAFVSAAVSAATIAAASAATIAAASASACSKRNAFTSSLRRAARARAAAAAHAITTFRVVPRAVLQNRIAAARTATAFASPRASSSSSGEVGERNRSEPSAPPRMSSTSNAPADLSAAATASATILRRVSASVPPRDLASCAMATSPAAGEPATNFADAELNFASSSSSKPAATPRHAANARRPTRFLERVAASSAAAAVPRPSFTASRHHARHDLASLVSAQRRVMRRTCASATARCFAHERHRSNTSLSSEPRRRDAKMDPALRAMSYDATPPGPSSSLLSMSRTSTETGAIASVFILAYSDSVLCCIVRSLARSALNPAMACSRSSVSACFCTVTALMRFASFACLSWSRTICSAPLRNRFVAALVSEVSFMRVE